MIETGFSDFILYKNKDSPDEKAKKLLNRQWSNF